MSRAFYPPDTLKDEDLRTIAQVRRDIWTAGFTGLACGSVSGYLLYASSRLLHSRLSESTKSKFESIIPNKDSKKLFSRNVAFLSVMAGGALGSFLLATAAGKNRVHNLHEIFEVGKTESKTSYQKTREEDISQNIIDEKSLAVERQKRILSRRNTVRRRIEQGHGLSDSHGGHWATSVDVRNDGEDR